jgi:2-polyprenyl-3-methyl-5-hydroxy-6-metoxy-1,4-benzoquinol methylase
MQEQTAPPPAPAPFALPHEFGIVQNNRRAMLLRWIDVGGKGLEIGPYSQPTIVKSEGDIRYLDVQTRAALVAALTDKAEATRVPEIDFLCASPDYASVAPGPFDYIVANHVLEHVANPIAWLQMVARRRRRGSAGS